MIANWIKAQYPKEQLIVGGYAYLDGEKHVRLALAMDGIMQSVCEARKDTMLAFLNTPTQVYVVPQEASKAALSNFKNFSLFNAAITVFRLLSGGKFCQQNARKPIQNDAGDS